MKKRSIFLALLLTGALLGGCKQQTQTPAPTDAVLLQLSDEQILADGAPLSSDSSQAVYTAHDIIYYEEGHDFTYGEGSAEDAHSAAEAASHTVVHITRPGTYRLSGTLSLGQIFVDLGEDAKKDPQAVVTLILDGLDITCEVAPAIFFYRVYECSSTDEASASCTVDTSAAGANVILADDSENTVSGSYVARIYKPGTVVLNEAGTEVEDAKKLHKYDGAFYSKMSMNLSGGSKSNGKLTINAENEGLDTELHLTVNGGHIWINSGNDGINTNEDNISVTTINGGSLTIIPNGGTGEGDGIDSNGWLVINGGTVYAQSCPTSGDAGIDSDLGIHLNGGTVIAAGNMLDRISESKQTFAVFQFSAAQTQGLYSLKDAKGRTVLEQNIDSRFSYLILSFPSLEPGDYTLWKDAVCYQGASSGQLGGFGGGFGGPGGNFGGNPGGDFGGNFPGGDFGGNPGEGFPSGTLPDGSTLPDGMQPPNGMTPPNGTNPGDFKLPDGTTPGTPPDGMNPGGGPGGNFGGGFPGGGNSSGGQTGTLSRIFSIKQGENYFTSVAPTSETA